MMKLFLAVIALSAVLTACASQPPYVPPKPTPIVEGQIRWAPPVNMNKPVPFFGAIAELPLGCCDAGGGAGAGGK